MAQVPSLCHSPLPVINNFAQLGYISTSMLNTIQAKLTFRGSRVTCANTSSVSGSAYTNAGGNQKKDYSVLRTQIQVQIAHNKSRIQGCDLQLDVDYTAKDLRWQIIHRHLLIRHLISRCLYLIKHQHKI